MGVNKFNSEGYYDPTAYEALKNITKDDRSYMPVVYVCSPYAGDTELNSENARRYCRFAVSRGCVPVAPHLLFPQFMNDESERDLAIRMDLIILSKCSELWVFGDRITSGMSTEIERAVFKGQPVRYFTNDLKEVKNA